MNKLKEIGDKYYQECEVVILPSNERAEVYTKNKNVLCIDSQTSILKDNLTLVSYPNRYRMKPQYLYFISNEKIKEGDWYLNIVSNEIVKVDFNIDYEQNHCKKIITTTDTSLGLPQPSKSFIQAFISAYNKGEKIEKVLVEYIFPNIINFGNCIYKEINGDGSYYKLVNGQVEKYKSLKELKELGADVIYILKLNSSNEITIKKVKDSWNREEVIQILVDYSNNVLNQKYRGNTAEVINQFVEENL